MQEEANAVKETPLFSHAAPVFPVTDVNATIHYYEEKLGFTCSFTYGEPVTYAVVQRGGVSIHLTAREDQYLPSSRHTALWIFVEDVNKVYAELHTRDIRIVNDIADRDYGMRDFDIRDLNGFILTFGTGLDRL